MNLEECTGDQDFPQMDDCSCFKKENSGIESADFSSVPLFMKPLRHVIIRCLPILLIGIAQIHGVRIGEVP